MKERIKRPAYENEKFQIQGQTSKASSKKGAGSLVSRSPPPWRFSAVNGADDAANKVSV
jgi:hypothetical protein